MKHDLIKEMLTADDKTTNVEIVDAIMKKFKTGIAPNVITQIRKSMGIKAVRGYSARARIANAGGAAAPKAAKKGAKSRGRPPKAKVASKGPGRGRGRPKGSVHVSDGTPSHILLVGGELIPCKSRAEVEEAARKALLKGALPEVYSKSERPFEFVVKLH
ncbi:MAG: hypothetical protein NUW37_18975 [Planctomycetes bacterium]|nr:hypothetical protein [Planctomycetota bacterium]